MVAQKYFTAETTYAVKLGTTKPIHESVGILPTDSTKRKEWKANRPRVIPNFGGRRQIREHNPNAFPQGPDPLYDPNAHRSALNEILPSVNIEGIGEGESGSTPPDVNGDIGREFYVEIVNATFFKVYDKNGTPVSNNISANSIWSQVGETSLGDPILLYDQEVDRWFLTEFPNGNKVLVAISHTSDPRGSWDAYTFQTPQFPDFPKYGIWGDAYYLTANESGFDFPVYAINREDILNGEATARIQRLTTPKIGGIFFEVGQPVDWDGTLAPPAGSPGIVVKLNDDDWGTTDQDEILFHQIHIDWENSAASNIEIIKIPTAPYDTDGCNLENTGGFSCIPQPNNQGIDGAEWIICHRAQYRNFGTHEAFVMAFMVDVTGEDIAGIRWIEFRKTSTLEWHIYQEGTVGSDDGIHRFMPSIALDGDGNIGLGYAVSGYDKFPSLRYTGRYAGDPLGTMTFIEYEFVSGNGSQGFDRFGDYFSMSVDPSDESTFWFAGEYFPSDNVWATRIVAFSASRDTIDLLPRSLVAPINNGMLGEQSVAISILNRGLATILSDFEVGYQYNNGNWVTETVDIDSLSPDQEYTHSFLTPISIDGPGTYPIRIATNLENDGNLRNDTLTLAITKYAAKDLAIEYIVPDESGVICEEESTVELLLRNTGFDTLRKATLELVAFGNAVDIIEWQGELPFGAETTISVIVNLIDGPNLFSVSVETLNEVFVDEITSNNEPEWILTAELNGEEITLLFTTDDYPEESTWQLLDEQNLVIAADGPFTASQNTYESIFCLTPGACYTFQVFDSFGDGLSSQGVQGDYEIFNSAGELLADLSDPDFGSETSSFFCLTAQCLLSLQVGIEHESSPGSADAVALGETNNSTGDVTYSIDGGLTFQPDGTFSNLPAGLYSMIAQDGAGCLDTIRFEVLACNLQALISTEPALGGDVGQIHISVSGENGTVLYSIQEGTFVTDSFFLMLEPGDYIVTVQDSAGCQVKDTVTVSTSVSSSYISDDYFLRISPNPGKGLYKVEASFQSEEIFIPYTVISSKGDFLFNGTLVRYDDLYKGEISLRAYPTGLYYVTFRSGQTLAVSTVIKAE